MKNLSYLIILVSLISMAPTRKRYLKYPIIIGKADLIVEGSITKLPFEVYEYEFEITQTLKGKSKDIITVDMWKEWTCDQRIKRLQVGQKLLLFLIKRPNGDYKIINGSTGELFISNEGNIETSYKEDFPKIDELKKGIQLFIQAYKYDGVLYYHFEDKVEFQPLVSRTEIKEMKEGSDFFKKMCSYLKEYKWSPY